MSFVQISFLLIQLLSFLIETPVFAHSSIFFKKCKPDSLNQTKETLTGNKLTDFSGVWRVTSKNCLLFEKNDTLQIEQNENFFSAYLNDDSEPEIITFGKVSVDGEDGLSYNHRNVSFSFWSEDGKTFYLNSFDIFVNKQENNTILQSIAWSMDKDQIHIRYKEAYSPEINKKGPRGALECILSRK